MKGLHKRDGIWRVRVAIPADLQVRWGKREEIVSLSTTDENEAIRLGAPKIADIKQRIKDMRKPAAAPLPPAPPAVARLTIPQTFGAIRQWRHYAIDDAYLDAFNGTSTPHDPVAASSVRYALQHHSTIGQITDFDARLAEVLSIPVDHPVIQRANVREWFRQAWSDVEGFRDRFQRDDFNGWPEERDAPLVAAATPSESMPVRDESRLTPLELYDRWSPVASIKLEGRNRGYVQRLDEFLVAKAIGQIEPHDLARFRVEALRFPNTKNPAVLARSFSDIIAWGEGEGAATPRLDQATIWKWLNTIKGMFAYAHKNRWIDINPAEDTMAKPPRKRKARVAFDAADIAEIFSKPAFTGFSGRVNDGYRDTPGEQVVRDAKFWMPIVALYTGARMEEIGSTLVNEIRQIEGIWVIDLLDRADEENDERDRSLKNEQSRRIVPLHDRLIDLGFLDYVKRQKSDGYLFPDLIPSMTPRGQRRTVNFSKWWGLFCKANATVKGEGMDAKKKPFHSFRHTAIRALRHPKANPVLARLLVGHEEGEFDEINDRYGEGADIKKLKETIDLIDYPTFRLAR